jgi:hypothetical protein
MIKELDRVVLVRAVPALGLEPGDIGTVVLVHDGGKGFEVEFVTLDGDTVAVATLARNDVRPIGRNEIAHARTLVA